MLLFVLVENRNRKYCILVYMLIIKNLYVFLSYLEGKGGRESTLVTIKSGSVYKDTTLREQQIHSLGWRRRRW